MQTTTNKIDTIFLIHLLMIILINNMFISFQWQQLWLKQFNALPNQMVWQYKEGIKFYDSTRIAWVDHNQTDEDKYDDIFKDLD